MNETEKTAFVLLSQIISPVNKGKSLPEIPERTWKTIVGLSAVHGVSGYLSELLKETGEGEISREIFRELTAAYAPLWRDSVAFSSVLGELQRVFKNEGIRFILLKGLHVAESVYGSLKKRPMQDIDLLVRKNDTEKADRLLRAMAKPEKWNKTWIEKYHYHLGYDMTSFLENSKTRLKIELHWDILPKENPFTISLNDIWKNAVKEKIAGVEIEVMSLEYLLLFLCVHLSFQHGFCLKIIHLLDIAEIVCLEKIDWEKFCQITLSGHAQRAVSLVFRTAEEIFGVNFPPETGIIAAVNTPDKKIIYDAISLIRDDPVLMHSAFSRFKKDEGLRQNFRSIFYSLFPKPDVIKELHGTKNYFPDIFLAYIYRMTGLLKKHGGAFAELVSDRARRENYRKHSKMKKEIFDWISRKTHAPVPGIDPDV
ncbi:nucleotidyltransferase family protein [candidate division WOR-3 bacterium]|nr:nucleotidyltransferase family protein [candidate division WOR-3 bacterium]